MVDVIPLLRGDIAVQPRQGSVMLVRGDLRYEFSGISSARLAQAFLSMDGLRGIVAVADMTGIDLDLLEQIVSFALERNLVVDLASDSTALVKPSEFLGVCRRLFPVWKRSLFEEDLWVGLASGSAPRQVFIGWLIESYHFIQGANDRLGLAVTHCPDPRIREVLAKHYVEEYDHGRFFLDSLAVVGAERQVVMQCRPLPATLAVLNHMRSAGRRDTLEYVVCSGFLESTGQDQKIALEFLDQVAKRYTPDQPEAIEPLIEHVKLDEEYGHPDNFETICSLLDPIPARRASAALTAGLLLAETLRLWSRDVQRSYEGGSGFRLDLHSYRPSSIAGRPVSRDEFTEKVGWSD